MVNVLLALPQDNIGTSLNVGINNVTKMKRDIGIYIAQAPQTLS